MNVVGLLDPEKNSIDMNRSMILFKRIKRKIQFINSLHITKARFERLSDVNLGNHKHFQRHPARLHLSRGVFEKYCSAIYEITCWVLIMIFL